MAQRDWADKDFYRILGVEKSASKDEVKRAYRRLAQKFHPDANKGDKDAERRFKEISEAHSVLSNDEKRREYDQMRAFVEAGGQRFYGFRPGGQGNVRINVEDIEDIFSGGGGTGSVFSDLFGFGSRARQRQGADIETEVTLDFEDAIAGATIEVSPASGSRGRGARTKVRIPAGVTDGTRIRVAGKGETPQGEGTPGDLYVRVHVKPHEIFELEKNGDLLVHVPLSIAEAALGTKVQVPTLDEPVTVRVPAGTSPGKTLRVRGRGGPRRGGGSGDLLVNLTVEIPKKLSREERKLLEQFQEVHEGSPRAHMDAYLKSRAHSETAS